MKRSIVLALLMGFGAVSLGVLAAQDGQMEIEVEQLEDNLYVLRGQGGGGNTAVFVTTDGVVVVDSKNPGWGEPILEAIQELTSNPVTTLINTHSHHDHVSGNVAFAETVQIVAHETTRDNMRVMRPYTGRTEPPANVFRDSGGHGIPMRTFLGTLTLGEGADRVDLYHFGRGHTGGDAWVAFPALRTLHAGDIFLGQRVPFIDAENGGSGVDLPDTLLDAHQNIQGINTIITGHSGQMTWDDLAEWAAFNRDFLQMVRDGLSAGRSVDDIAAAWSLPAAYSHYDAPNEMSVRRNIQVIADEIAAGR
jgi:glyoxylase-like metal-dependent hydrolase (beta-lactamase superfamily II)